MKVQAKAAKYCMYLLGMKANIVVLFSLTRLLPAPCKEDVVPAEDGDDPHGGAGPGEGDHDEGALLGAAAEVAERRRDGPVAVEREDEQVEDGGRRGRVVHRQPELAHHVAESPVA